MACAVFVSNLPRSRGARTVLAALTAASGVPLASAQATESAGGLRLDLANADDFRALAACHGSFVFNQRVWVTKFPSPRLLALHPVLARLIAASLQSGFAALTNVRRRVAAAGGDAAAVDFASADFVEFLFATLGAHARDEMLAVEGLALGGDDIRDARSWGGYLLFLPGLRTLDLTGCPLRAAPAFAAAPHVRVTWATVYAKR